MDTGDRVLCHACGRVWLRNLYDTLDCPYCSSDFTEIIEIPPDTDPEPEASPVSSPSPSSSQPHPDPPESFPGQRSPSPFPASPFANHDPWGHMNDGDDHGWIDPGYHYTHRTFQSPGGNIRFTYQLRRGPGATRGMGHETTDPASTAFQGFDSFIHNMGELNRERAARAQGPGSPSRPQPPRHAFDNMYGPGNAPRSPHGRHHGPGGLFPRDANGPQPMDSPLQNLGEMLDIFHTNITNLQAGQPGGSGRPGGPNIRVMNGGADNPIGALLAALLNISRNGDAVYSQEELDRVISELVEQAGNRTAAPPASQDAIHALPKKIADAGLLGGEGTECSICMDAVKVGDEVTVLPCTHWFHPQCIEMWLNQHNSCPHCRRGVEPTTAPGANAPTPTSSEGNYDQAERPDTNANNNTPSTATDEGQRSRPRTTSRGESTTSTSSSGGWTGWVRSRLGGSGS
ncbi:putative RING finger domain protein [Aspergillus mulundensis]|uniref:RING-type E3 ubiquitin transferase n=1 Tax=Aspergillus mulundensis TaxID=1810919 RepID=A0A3D8SVN4_9EURO|nr:hypothetical protein DSM5745_02135 [Aspergillus mulundensis]RDW90360.1 hypothetical protein DSM5745_02135 [Aspergillus mulundensis]